MQRISGSTTACLIAIAGYILLVLVFPEFIVALPLLELEPLLTGAGIGSPCTPCQPQPSQWHCCP